jgi:hypothetical protein
LKELVKIVKNTGDYIELKDVNRNFYLIISDPKQSASNVKNVTFIFTTMPSSDLHLAASGTPYNSEVVLKGIEDWVKRIKRFNAAEKQRQKLIQEQNEEDTYIPFEEVEEDDKHLSPEEQQKIDASLQLLQNSLEENKAKYAVENIIEEVITLRQSLATLPERVIKQIGQKIIKKIVDLGQDAVKDIIVDGMKGFIKYLFLNEAIKQVLNHLHLLS